MWSVSKVRSSSLTVVVARFTFLACNHLHSRIWDRLIRPGSLLELSLAVKIALLCSLIRSLIAQRLAEYRSTRRPYSPSISNSIVMCLLLIVPRTMPTSLVTSYQSTTLLPMLSRYSKMATRIARILVAILSSSSQVDLATKRSSRGPTKMLIASEYYHRSENRL